MFSISTITKLAALTALVLASSTLAADDSKVHLTLYAETGLQGDTMETDVAVDVCYNIAPSGCFNKLTASLEWTVPNALKALNGSFYASMDCSGDEVLSIENMDSDDGKVEDFDKEDLSEAKNAISSFAIRSSANVGNMSSVVGCDQS